MRNDGPLLAQEARRGNRRALARLLSLVENGTAAGMDALAELFPYTGQAHVIGITGSPGAGKSTLVNRLARAFRQTADRVAIVAVDPTSPFSGGALLGDRLRMRDLINDTGIFIRSMASRGHPGGIARATHDVVAVLDAVGFPVILVETVGAGQAQVDVARVAHTVVLVEAPGMGDDIQALKAGLMEIADLIVVNKSDRPDARHTVRMLQSVRHGVTAGHHGPTVGEQPAASEEGWDVPILLTSALEDRGIDALQSAITAHRRYLEQSGQWETRLAQHARAEVEHWMRRHWESLQAAHLSPERWQAAVSEVTQRATSPATVARALLDDVLASVCPDVEG